MITDLCGPEGATQAIGFLLGLCSIPLTVGPPVAGLLYDQTKSYTISFLLAGIPSLIGALIMTLIHRLKDDNVQDSKDQEADAPLAKQAWNEGNQLIVLTENYSDEAELCRRRTETDERDHERELCEWDDSSRLR